MNQIKRGKFITFEGIDGAGKSAHLDHVKTIITDRLGFPCYSTREPGGTPVGERLREILINEEMDPDTEALIATASRNEHVRKVIVPKLETGEWVLSDRFYDSSYAYQCAGQGVDLTTMVTLNNISAKTLIPDLTFLFDVPLDVAKERMGNRLLDKFESQDTEFFKRVQDQYHKIARANTHRIVVIDATHTIEQIQQVLTLILMNRDWDRKFFTHTSNVSDFLNRSLIDGTASLEPHPFGGSLDIVDKSYTGVSLIDSFAGTSSADTSAITWFPVSGLNKEQK